MVRFASDHQVKGVSPAVPAVTLHATDDTSRQHFDTPGDEIAGAMLEEVADLLGPIAEWTLHRWRYATPRQVTSERALAVDYPGLVAFAGDAFGGPRVEGAALSGLAAAAAVIARLG